tara:strand:- start:1337 stop:1636 length:300 start_codon:yes stop_codon:yes gene_type:complete
LACAFDLQTRKIELTLTPAFVCSGPLLSRLEANAGFYVVVNSGTWASPILAGLLLDRLTITGGRAAQVIGQTKPTEPIMHVTLCDIGQSTPAGLATQTF